ncbi:MULTISPECIES: GNAT family N-acetyltransferase [Pontibacillus]|uniref:GNAT family N-acetyltransferase n=1 Tax=Pontibacillus chungwhensis TaxID=265426 RepID=A0ABY8V3Z9_9BACI|nr:MULTISPECIES: GNAT family N-acetyltransferase [Pontibacillus]MCD5324378.1 GNAT family N-acetyltransferase [Pontibacillus sp. HN14]WIF99324.1 GNAT family N-acetyltransferase [Pontibacillus chungwhensis]
MRIREIETSDAEGLATLTQQVEGSSQFMLWEKGERMIGTDSQLKMIERMKNNENSTILVAEDETRLVGYLLVMGGNAKRNKHAAAIVVGILEGYRGKGIGTQLFKELEQWASKHRLRRLELTVITRNEAGLSLYKKMGFEIEGVKKDSLRIDGEYVDEYYMAKIL